MKILIAADIFPPQSGGPATYVVALANELAKKGDIVKIVSLNPESDAGAVSSGVVAVKNKNKLLRYLEYLYLLWKNAKDAEIIYAMGPVNAGFPALITAKLTGKKLVTKIVGDYAWEQGVQRFGVKDLIDDFQVKNNYSFWVKLLKWIEKKVAQNSSLVIVPSLYLKGIVVGWGLSVHCVSVVYNEVEYVPVNPIEHKDEKWVVSVGRLISWKGMDTLIEIMPDLLKKIHNLKLKIVGDGPVIEDLRKKVKDLNLENSVELTGNLSKEKASVYMASADVFVLNSGYEGYSHVLIEAHNQGAPVLASRAGGNAEVVAGDALFEYNNKEEIKEKILANINTPKREPMKHGFLRHNMIDETRQILQSLCKLDK